MYFYKMKLQIQKCLRYNHLAIQWGLKGGK